MKTSLFSLASLLLVISTMSSSYAQESQDSVNKTTSSLLEPWGGPYGGVPAWHLVRTDEFVPAFKAAIAQAQREIESIATNPEPASFENTIVELEKLGKPLARINAIFGVYSSNLNTGPVPGIERIVVPMLAEHEDSIVQNEKLVCPHRRRLRRRRVFKSSMRLNNG